MIIFAAVLLAVCAALMVCAMELLVHARLTRHTVRNMLAAWLLVFIALALLKVGSGQLLIQMEEVAMLNA